jgi:hypothetical protein
MLGMSLLLGARGLGALIGPLVSARWAGHSQRRLRLGVFFGYIVVGIGYASLGFSSTLWLACLCAAFAHMGGSTVWVFSTTILQLNTDDRFRGRVFAADLGFSMLTIAIGAYVCGRFLDVGFSPRSVAVATGLVMIVPTVLWGRAMRSAARTRATAIAD